ncbi:MAG: galactokinase [Actinomycetota bacterium]
MRIVAPGRVNLIGDHTDYTGGLVLPMAIDRATVIDGEPGGDRIMLTSIDEPDPVDLPLRVDHPESVSPAWGRYVAGVVSELAPTIGFRGTVTTAIPIGAGLSSSAALELAVALALGAEGSPLDIALMCQRAEQRASGVPSGIMDQWCIAAGLEGHALMMDCGTLLAAPVRIPDDVEVVVQFVAHRTLVGSPYADRVAECATAEAAIGPLRDATLLDTGRIGDPVAQRRARHVVAENQRVRDMAAALELHELADAGRLMVESHESLRDLYETSTPQMDAAVARLVATPGVWGARMTGGGFGGCVVALTQPGALTEGWIVRPTRGAHVSP